MYTFKLSIIFIILIIQISSISGFLNGTNYKCDNEGSLIELPNHLRKPCILCTCRNGLVLCDNLKICTGNYKQDRKRRSIRCIEEECCDVIQDVFVNNVDNSSKLISYRTEDESGEINNQIRTSTIRYVHCTKEISKSKKDQSDSENFNTNINQINNQLNHRSSSNSRSTINIRSVTAYPKSSDRQSVGLCTLSNSLNTDTNKHRQHITTLDGMRMRLRNGNHCQFVFSRDCVGEQFTIHLLYSKTNHSNNKSTNSSKKQNTKFDLNRSTDNSINDQSYLDLINFKKIKELDGKSTSNYTQRYLKQTKNLGRERLNLFVRIGKRKLHLDSNLNVKIDNHPTLLPYMHRGINIVHYQNYIIIKSDIGLKIIWSGQEIVTSLSKNFQRRTCGLCGNFNNDLTDDLKNRKGQLLQSQLRFFESWTTGKNRQCLVNNKHKSNKSNRLTNENFKVEDETNLISNETDCKWTFKKKMKATRFCNSLKINMPLECRDLETKNYYETCMEQICACNTKNCNCQVLASFVDRCSKMSNSTQILLAFQNECPNLKVNITSQVNNLNQSRSARNLELLRQTDKNELDELLDQKSCPEGSSYSLCAPIDKYKVTCSDLLSFRSEFSNRLFEQLDLCQPGCKCKASKVWSNSKFNKCIPIDLCSTLSTNLRKRTINSLNSLINRPRFTFLN